AQPDALGLAPLPQQYPIAGQRLRVGRVRGRFGDVLLDQVQWAVRFVGPSVQVGTSKATPPGLIGKAQSPVRRLLGQSDQAVTPPFFRAYPGSGLVIQCLARCQLMPRRSRVWRMVSPLTRVGTIPWATLTSAAHSRVQTLVGWPKSRGRRCKRVRRR